LICHRFPSCRQLPSPAGCREFSGITTLPARSAWHRSRGFRDRRIRVFRRGRGGR